MIVGVRYPTVKDAGDRSFHAPAARVILKLRYSARMARPDLLRSISYLARYLTKWDESCDTRLHKLMAYVHNTRAYKMYAWEALLNA